MSRCGRKAISPALLDASVPTPLDPSEDQRIPARGDAGADFAFGLSMRRFTVLLVLVLAFAQAACGGDSPTSPTGGSNSSAASTSHNAGRDCLSCHGFTVAGTVYRADGVTVSPGAVVRLTTESGGGGTVAATLTADGSGNFYTGTPVGFGTGLFVTASSTAGAVRSKPAPITSGACNRCHTNGTRIVVD